MLCWYNGYKHIQAHDPIPSCNMSCCHNAQCDIHVHHFSSPCPPHTQALLWSTRTQLKWWRRHFNIFIDLWTHFISPKMTTHHLAYMLISRFRGCMYTHIFIPKVHCIGVFLFLCINWPYSNEIHPF